MWKAVAAGLSLLVLAACGQPGGKGEAGGPVPVSIAFQNGVAYIPFHVMREQKLVEKHARALGVEVGPDYKNLGQAAFIRDALIAGQIQFGVAGPPTLLTMHEKTGGDIKAVGGVISVPMWLNTTNAAIKSICDFGPADKIALPTLKSSVQAVALQMAAKEQCGDPYKADRFTVSMPHPDGFNALMTGMVSSHMTTPPFALEEIDQGKGKVRTLLDTYKDVFRGHSSLVYLLASDKWRQANPKAYQAVRDAFFEAEAFIRADPRAAAEVYLRAEKDQAAKYTLDDIVAQITRPDVEYSEVPRSLGRYSSFMKEIGTLKQAYEIKALTMLDANLQGAT